MQGFKTRAQSHAVVAGDVTAGEVTFAFGDAFQVKGAVVAVRTAAGAAKAWDGVASWDGETVTVNNAGSADWAATDVITVIAFG